MRLLSPAALVAALMVPVLATPALALRIAMPNLNTAQKTAQADTIVVGKVTAIEKEQIEVEPFKGAPEKIKLNVAVVKIETVLQGSKNVTHLKVVFQPAPPPAPEGPNVFPPPVGGGIAVRPLPGRGRIPTPELKVGDEGLFFFTNHATADKLTIELGFTPVKADDEKFKEEVAKVKATMQIYKEPVKALKTEKAEDRLAAAAALIGKYRTYPRNAQKVDQVAIPAEETQLILKVLYEADWTVADQPKPGFDYTTSPTNMASMLTLYPGQNGMPKIQPKPGESYNKLYAEAFKTWYKTGAEKFEIKKMVETK